MLILFPLGYALNFCIKKMFIYLLVILKDSNRWK